MCGPSRVHAHVNLVKTDRGESTSLLLEGHSNSKGTMDDGGGPLAEIGAVAKGK